MTDPKETPKAFLYIVCNMPTGILLELGNKGEPGYQMQLVKGANEGKFGEADGRFTALTESGYGLTKVAAPFWNQWKGKNGAIVAEWKRNRILDVFDEREEADMFRTANADATTGFEPFNPKKMPQGLEPTDRPNAR